MSNAKRAANLSEVDRQKQKEQRQARRLANKATQSSTSQESVRDRVQSSSSQESDSAESSITESKQKMADIAAMQAQLDNLAQQMQQLIANPPAPAPAPVPVQAALPNPPPPNPPPIPSRPYNSRTAMGDRMASLIAPYSGAVGDDFLAWIQRFETVANSCSLQDAEMIKVLPAYLLDMAAEKFGQIPRTTRDAWTTFAEMRAALIAKFVDDAHAYACGTKLFRRKYESTEGIFQYAQALLKLAQGAYGQERATAMRNDVLKDIFLRGLPSHLSTRLYIDYPKTWDEAVAAAERLADATAQCTAAAAHACVPGLGPFDSASFSPSPTPTSTDSLMLAVLQQNQQLMKAATRGNQKTKSSFRGYRGNYNPQQQQNRPYCNYCQSVGHHWGNCFKRQGVSDGNFPRGGGGYKRGGFSQTSRPYQQGYSQSSGYQGSQPWRPHRGDARTSSYYVQEPSSYEESFALSPYDTTQSHRPLAQQSTVTVSDYERKCAEYDLLLAQNRQLQNSFQMSQNKASPSPGNPFLGSGAGDMGTPGSFLVFSEGEKAEMKQLEEIVPSKALRRYMADPRNLSPSAPPFDEEWEETPPQSPQGSPPSPPFELLSENEGTESPPKWKAVKLEQLLHSSELAVPEISANPLPTVVTPTPTPQPCSVAVPHQQSLHVNEFRPPFYRGPQPVPLLSFNAQPPIMPMRQPLLLNRARAPNQIRATRASTPLLPRPNLPPQPLGQVRPEVPRFLPSAPNLPIPSRPIGRPLNTTIGLHRYSILFVALLSLIFSIFLPAVGAAEATSQMDLASFSAGKQFPVFGQPGMHSPVRTGRMATVMQGTRPPDVELRPVSLPILLLYVFCRRFSCSGFLSELLGFLFVVLFFCGPFTDFCYHFSVFWKATSEYVRSIVLHVVYLIGMPAKFLVKVQVGGRPVVALLDCGSTISILSTGFARSLPSITFDPPRLSPCYSITGHNLNFKASTRIPIRLGHFSTTQRCEIVDSSPYDLILGTDFLTSLKFLCFDFVSNRLIIPGGSVPLFAPEIPSYDFPINAAVSEIIPPWTEACFSARIPPLLNGQTILVDEMAPKFASRGLFLAKSVNIPEQNQVLIRVVNPQPFEVVISQGMTIGRGSLVDTQASVSELTAQTSEKPPKYPVEAADPHPLPELDLHNADLSPPQKSALRHLLVQFAAVFSRGPFDLGRSTLAQHRIDTGDSAPHRCRPHRLPAAQRPVVSKHVDTMLKQGVIAPSHSPWGSPVVIVKKKSGEDRFCVDYRRLNQITKKDLFPLPRIDEILDSLGTARIFSTLDLASGFWQLPIHPEDQEKTAFVTFRGLFEWKVLPFGLCGSPAFFQRAMELALVGLQWQNCLIYMDDIIVFSSTFEQHLKDLEVIFRRLQHHNLKLKAKKCCFGRKTIPFLGHVISKHGIAADPNKLAAFQQIPAPINMKTLKSFVSLASYYRRFLRSFAQIAQPLYKLQQKEVRWCWTRECQKAYETLKEKLVSPPILAFPNFSKPFLLETDASGFGLGAILSQKQDDGTVRIISCASRTMNRAERNYSATEREALAIVWAVKTFRPYLYGHYFTIVTDHSALKWLMTCTNPSGRLQRWALTLQEHNFEIQHKPGKAMGHVDALSRLTPGGDAVLNVNPLVLAPLAQQQREDVTFFPIIIYLETGALPPDLKSQQLLLSKVPQYRLNNQVLFHLPPQTRRCSYQFPMQIVVPVPLRSGIISLFHDNVFGGHLGFRRTRDKIQMRYFWPGLDTDVDNWIRSCHICSAKKNPIPNRQAPLQPIPVSGPFDRLAVDVIGPLPMTLLGNRFIVAFTDYHTKWAEAFATSDHTAATVARLLFTEIICRHGSPLELLSDQGPEFLSSVVAETCQLSNIKHVFTSAYHPQTDGLQERFNGTLIRMISSYVNQQQTDWDSWIPFCLFAYRTAYQESIKETPFYMLYNRDARQPSDLMFQQHRSPYVVLEEDSVQLAAIRFSEANELALQQISLAQNRQKRYYDRKTNTFPWKISDNVWLFSPATKPGQTSKLTKHWDGLFEIQALKLPRALLLNPQRPSDPPFWVHVNRLKPAIFRAPHLLPTTKQPLPAPTTHPKPPPQPVANLPPQPEQAVRYMTRFQTRMRDTSAPTT